MSKSFLIPALVRMAAVLCFANFYGTLVAQEIRHKNAYPASRCYNCSAYGDWNIISEKQVLSSSPYHNILHLAVKQEDDIKHYGSTSFISRNVLITAKHCINSYDNLTYIELRNAGSNNWIKLSKLDFQVIYYPQLRTSEQDIALIKITNKGKLKAIYKSHFTIVDSAFSINKNSLIVNVSGFPCTKFAINSISPDTLVNRSVDFSAVEFSNSGNLIGHPLCMCNGDSGGPIWYQ